MFQFASADKIVFGAGALQQLPLLAGSLGSRVVLVLGESLRFQDTICTLLAQAPLDVEVATVVGEPTVQDVVALVAQARPHRCDLVIAVGGGSVIDGAKAMAALLANPGNPMNFLEVVGKGMPLTRASIPMIAVPTTSGTGAEVTKNAVLSATEHRVKVSLRSETMLPRVALIDPELSLGLPPELTAATGLDALTQVLEPYVSCLSNPITDALSHKGLSLARTALRAAYRDGSDLSARTDMALTSVLGGLSLANSKLGAVHGLAGPLGGMFSAPHGAVCARLLPLVCRQNIKSLRERKPNSPGLERFHEVARVLTQRADATAEEGADWLQQLADDLSVPGLSTYGLSVAALSGVVDKSQRASSMKGNPLVLTQAELLGVLEAAL